MMNHPDEAALDRRIIAATQEGLPLVPEPYAKIAQSVGAAEDQVIERLEAMQDSGVIRRIAAVPNHYALGLAFNGMTVWDVDDEEIASLGPRVGALPFVTHCYRRPRVDGQWPYNLFAMVHGRDRAEVMAKVKEIAQLLGPAARAHDVLFSTRILKKTGFRLQG
jgi:DNA-binding Lrp family transcriptional regulator